MTIHYPGADRTYDYSRKYPGSHMDTNTIILHTTEGGGLVDYNGGAVAPNLTIDVRRRKVWQHFPLDMSSRALRNLAGGVQTNSLNVCQIEIIGSCDPNSRVQPKSYDFTDDELRFVGEVLRTIARVCPNVSLNLTPKGFVPYPRSAQRGAPQRMTFDEWNNFSGVAGHQHVPENTHGDPGNMNVQRALDLSAPGGEALRKAPESLAATNKAPAQTTAQARPGTDKGAIDIHPLRPGGKGWSVLRYRTVALAAHGKDFQADIRKRYGTQLASDAWGKADAEITRALYAWYGRADPSWLTGDTSTPGPSLLRRLGFTRINGA